MSILNLGCGCESFGTHRVDKFKTPTTTHVFDVEFGIQFPDNFFDEVYERNLLEHLRNVGFHLEECYRVLKKDGTLHLITDNASCMRYYIYGTHTGKYEKEHKDDKHYSIFTSNHLKNHLEETGFREIKINFAKTNTKGRMLDKVTKFLGFKEISNPRIEVWAKK